MTPTPRVAIHYRRLPDRLRVYDQRVLLERDDVVITLSEPLDLDEPMTFEGGVMLENDSLALWFTFPGAWHDIGLFHTADGHYTGLYANVITPPVMEEAVWDTTDLFLDVWWPAEGSPRLLDEDELAEARAAGHIDDALALRAQEEAARLLEKADAGTWPPPVVEEWTLDRALAALER